MVCGKQLEAEIPSLENAFFSKNSFFICNHESNALYYLMIDSHVECIGPSRLFPLTQTPHQLYFFDGYMVTFFGDSEIAEWSSNSGHYSLLVNMYEEVNSWSDVANIWTKMMDLSVEKRCLGSSWIEINKGNSFFCGFW